MRGTHSKWSRGDPDGDAFNDCILVSDVGKRFVVSKQLVIRRLPAWAPLLESHTDGSTPYNTIRTSISTGVLDDITDFLRNNDAVPTDWLRLELLLDEADKWKLKAIEDAVLTRFACDITQENCIAVWKCCKDHSSIHTNKVFHYLLYVLNEAIKNEQNLDFYQIKVDDLMEILTSDFLNVRSEVEVWHLIKTWILAERKVRQKYLRNLLQTIRFAHLNYEECRAIVNDELVKGEISDEHQIVFEICTKQRIPRDIIIACFGWHGKQPSSAVEAFDVFTYTWRKSVCMEIGHKVAYHACVVIGLKMYIAGGYDGDTFFNDFRCYDAERMKWLEMAPMHNARCYVAGCELNGRVFVCGGSDGHERLKSAEIYDTEKNQWTQLRDMHFARSDAAACTMNGRVYVVGGFNGDFVLQSVEMYIPDSDLWIEIATMNTPRSGLACVVDRDSIVIAGGFDGSARLSSVERLRSSSSYTVMLPPMPSARSNFGMCKYGDIIYVVGGYAKGVTSSVLQFDGYRWSEISALNIARSATKAVVLRAWPNPERIVSDGQNGSGRIVRTEHSKSGRESEMNEDDSGNRRSYFTRIFRAIS
uniref:BACK domain-containing protein n=2 Tax=Parascaris univalens TaxID=6257 RepID=A0A915A2C6_PARUN